MRIDLLSLLLGCLMTFAMQAQTFDKKELSQGYALRGDDVHFVFDASLYEENPSKVVVTGAFRNWDPNMNDAKWQLSKDEKGLWTLTVQNPNYEVLSPQTSFKFRTDEGKWLDPPAEAPNSGGRNLIFLYDLPKMEFSAELCHPTSIWVNIQGMERPLDPAAYRLTDAQNTVIPIASVLPNTASETLITPAQPLDLKRVYFLEIPQKKLKVHLSFDGWFRQIYDSKPLGANISEDGQSTQFRIFAPRATSVKLYLYDGPETETAKQVLEMTEDGIGSWEAVIPENLKGTYYDFTVHGHNDPGNLFFETEPIHISDPYARVNMDAWGRSRVWPATRPASPLQNGIPALQDIIAYEVHVQDFTDQLPISDDLKGTIPGMIEPNLKNEVGAKIGFDYLIDLGINVVHLMPVQEFLHYPDKDWEASFGKDPYMIEQGVDKENYQWGYRTTHCFAVESKFRKKGTEPGAERDQFRDLVQAFHDRDIAVIIDIVPNHTGENMDGNNFRFHFNVLGKQYYYRTKDFEHIGAYGNEVKTENRPMVQRWLIDQCKHWIEEFGIDGFRIDLAGQIDKQTLIKLREALGPDIIIYGEPWIGSNDPAYEENPDWDWYKADSPITFFQDEARNAFKGPVFELNSKERDRGWPGGKWDEKENVKKGLSNSFVDDKTPLSGINYLDIHDNFALADQFGTTDFDGRFGVDEEAYKIAAVLLYTSLGPIVTHGGSEMMRSKGYAPLKEVVKTTQKGYTTYFHGKRDTCNHRTANNFVWENAGKSRNDTGGSHDYRGMYRYWKGLNQFRLSDVGKVFRQAEKVPEDYYQWIDTDTDSAMGYIVDEKVLVLLNPGADPISFDIALPKGEWKRIANVNQIDPVNGIFKEMLSSDTQKVEMNGQQLGIWVKE